MLSNNETVFDAIYARQSIDKADSISVESQVEYCKFETRGNPYLVFADKGYSGKNTDRPDFQRMMQQIRHGQIRRVLCYKLDRCSRSILDFTALIEELQKYGVEFISCTEKFDTSTPMGRAMLNICIVFAQLERETIQQRVTDAYRSRSQKGFYMGGRVPFGFRLEACEIQGKRTSCYQVVEEEVYILPLLFSRYAEPNSSLGTVAASLQEDGIKNPRSPDGQWSRSTIAKILANPIYVKADLQIYQYFKTSGVSVCSEPHEFAGRNGCYLYSGQQNQQYLVVAPHEGIVSSELWLRCRKKKNKRKAKVHIAASSSSILTGKLRCAFCGRSLAINSSKKTSGNVYRYIICPYSYGQDNSCQGIRGWRLEQMEEITECRLLLHLKNTFPILRSRNAEQNYKKTAFDLRIAQIQCEIEKTMVKAMETTGPMLPYLNERIETLKQEKEMLIRKNNGRTIDKVEIEPDYEFLWRTITFSEKNKIMDTLVESITVSTSELRINWKL